MRRFCLLFAVVFGVASGTQAGVLDFTSGLPCSGDGAVTFDVSDTGVTSSFTPVDNQVGGPRWITGPNGFSFGGGGGSSIELDFVANADVTCDSDTLGGGAIQLGNPDFNIDQGAVTVSGPNDANMASTTFPFAGGPINIDVGVTCTFEVLTNGAGVPPNHKRYVY